MLFSLDMNKVNIRNVDLNLLVVFAALASEKNVSRAANKLHLTQSAVSHALTRLRDTFGDPLFVRNTRGITPTPRALELQIPIEEVLEKAEGLLNPAKFDPKTIQATYQLTTTDYF
jgi:DNA-binding transcriptional LysR family regulator